MIYIPRTEAPQFFLKLIRRRKQLENMRQWLMLPPDRRGSPPYYRPHFADYPEVLEHIHKEFKNKCAFCERWLNNENGRLILFRPRRASRQEREGIPDPQHYFWLIWDWSNLYWVCQDCRDNQGSLFPTDAERVTPEVSHLDRENADYYFVVEQPILIDPCHEAPAKHIVFGEKGEIKAREGSKRGERTIHIFELDREPLCRARAEEARQFKELWQQARDLTIQNQGIVDLRVGTLVYLLLAECDDKEQFAGMKRQLLHDWINHENSLSHTPEQFKSALRQPPWRDIFSQVKTLLYPQIDLPMPGMAPPPTFEPTSSSYDEPTEPFGAITTDETYETLAELVKLLSKISVTSSYDGRTSLLYGIPSVTGLKRKENNILEDLTLIVNQLWEMGTLASGAIPHLRLIENAKPYIEGFRLSEELEILKEKIRSIF